MVVEGMAGRIHGGGRHDGKAMWSREGMMGRLRGGGRHGRAAGLPCPHVLTEQQTEETRHGPGLKTLKKVIPHAHFL